MIPLETLALELGGEVYEPRSVKEPILITGVAPLSSAKEGELSFFVEARLKDALEETKASVVVLQEKRQNLRAVQLIHPNPRLAIALVCQRLYPEKHTQTKKSHLSCLHEEAKVHESVTLYPYSFVDKGAKIAKNCILYPGVHIGADCELGEGTVIYSNTVLMKGTKVGQSVTIHSSCVLGADGFGFVPTKDENVKVPQLGRVVIEDFVEIGALCTIDRATFGETIVRKGTKLDAQVHIGHNVDIGELSLVCAQVGFGGSSKVGKRFIAAGQSAVGAAVTIGDGVILGPRAGTMKDIKEPGEYLGFPTLKKNDWIREKVFLKKLPQFQKEINNLKKKIRDLEKTIGGSIS